MPEVSDELCLSFLVVEVADWPRCGANWDVRELDSILLPSCLIELRLSVPFLLPCKLETLALGSGAFIKAL